MTAIEDEWLWGWDTTPAIVSVWAGANGRVIVWRRPEGRDLVREHDRFRPWFVLSSLDDLAHLGRGLVPESQTYRAGDPHLISYEELDGPGELRFVVRANDGRRLAAAILSGASRRLGRGVRHLRELGPDRVLSLPPDEQYLVATGRTYFRDLGFDQVRRAQIDFETTGLDPARDRIFLAAIRDADGVTDTLEASGIDDRAEAMLIRRCVDRLCEIDPDVIENHNLHGFDLPFLARRAEILAVPLCLGRAGPPGLRERPSARGGGKSGQRGARRVRYGVIGREMIDSLDAIWRHDFSARDLPGHSLKAVARHIGVARPDREHVPGARVYEVYLYDPDRVRRYAVDDVQEAAGVARLFGGAAFALARMAPRRYERLADAGPATGVIDPLLVRAYLRSHAALPIHSQGDNTAHTGAALFLFATGVARRIVKADVASLYPSLMRSFKIGPSRDRLGVLVSLVDRLVEQRLAAKSRAKLAPIGSPERMTDEALSAAMKLVVNSAYGYLGAVGLTRFADVHAANAVTSRGRELLGLICRELAMRGVTLIEADTDGVYFSVPESWTELDERRVVREVASCLPPLVQLEYEARYAAMLSHEPKNYALKPYRNVGSESSSVLLRGVAFRSRRAEPYGEEFLRRAIAQLLDGDVRGVHEVYLQTIDALRNRRIATRDVASLVRLTRTPEEYMAIRTTRRELAYEALLASGRVTWERGSKLRVYRAVSNRPGLIIDDARDDDSDARAAYVDPRDYDVVHYVRLLRATFAARLTTAFAPADFATVFCDPDQLGLFAPSVANIRPILTSDTTLVDDLFSNDPTRTTNDR